MEMETHLPNKVLDAHQKRRDFARW